MTNSCSEGQKIADIHDIYKRDISWSMIESWFSNKTCKTDYIKRYIQNVDVVANKYISFGREFSEWIASPTCKYELHAQIPKFDTFEKRVIVEYGCTTLQSNGKYRLKGYIDTYSTQDNIIGEYKTSVNMWDKDKADSHMQTDLYAYILSLLGTKVDKCYLWCLQTTDRYESDEITTDQFMFLTGELNEYHKKPDIDKAKQLLDLFIHERENYTLTKRDITQLQKTYDEPNN